LSLGLINGKGEESLGLNVELRAKKWLGLESLGLVFELRAKKWLGLRTLGVIE